MTIRTSLCNQSSHCESSFPNLQNFHVRPEVSCIQTNSYLSLRIISTSRVIYLLLHPFRIVLVLVLMFNIFWLGSKYHFTDLKRTLSYIIHILASSTLQEHNNFIPLAYLRLKLASSINTLPCEKNIQTLQCHMEYSHFFSARTLKYSSCTVHTHEPVLRFL